MDIFFAPVFMKMSIFEMGAMFIVLLNVWLYGRLSLWGPIFGVLGCVMWIVMGVRAELYGLVILNIILMSQNIWNYIKWSHNAKLTAAAKAQGDTATV